jgi:phage baseplate assembly protein W
MVNPKLYSDHWAYDLSKDLISKGEIYDQDVISQSIEMILTTMFGERLFNPQFGCSLSSYLFETINVNSGEALLDEIISQITKQEDRVMILSQQAALQILNDESAIILTLPYVVKMRNVVDKFKKKINF